MEDGVFEVIRKCDVLTTEFSTSFAAMEEIFSPFLGLPSDATAIERQDAEKQRTPCRNILIA
jgi:hypothetical protein